MKKLETFVRGIPKAQPRAKACRFGAHSRVYTPGSADEWKALIRLEVNRVWDQVRFEGPLSVNLQFFLPRPKSHLGARGLKDWAPRYHTGTPDADNLAKAVMDALTNLGIWHDDGQVSTLLVVKQYTNTEVSGCTVSIRQDIE